MSEPIPGLYSKLPSELKGSQFRSIADYYGKPLVFHEAKIIEGEFGDKAVFTVSADESSAKFGLSTYASQPLNVCKWMIETAPLPLRAVFVQRGREVRLIDPSAQVESPPSEDIPF